MSFRDLRSFTEKMRALGYPRLISMDSFRLCNFEAVADILLWLVKSYDPSFDVLDDLSSEQDRVIFIKSVALFMASKANIKLNTRKLYTADGHAVKELYKIASVLYEASRIHRNEDLDQIIQPPLDISSKLSQLRSCRALASSITEQGSSLYDALKNELELRDIRQQVISRPFDLRSMEAAILGAVETLKAHINDTRSALEGLSADETNLVAKIDKRKNELERAEKRLKSLQGVRPAYMDEYEKIEVELVKLYEVYMDKFRNLAYLEQQLDEHDKLEQDKFEETEQSLKKMQSRLREEEMQLLKGDKEIRDTVRSKARPDRPHAAGRRSRTNKNQSDDSDLDDLGSGPENGHKDRHELNSASDADDQSVHMSEGSSDRGETGMGAVGRRSPQKNRPGEGGGGGMAGTASGARRRHKQTSDEMLIDRRESGDSSLGDSDSDGVEAGFAGSGKRTAKAVAEGRALDGGDTDGEDEEDDDDDDDDDEDEDEDDAEDDAQSENDF
ncbi:Clusterin-associated protein 1 [Entophlyctis luteolus]|nr:Clusterin-associated protein 1 [Entophlyctis luteolus]